jgi:hypothetical protein
MKSQTVRAIHLALAALGLGLSPAMSYANCTQSDSALLDRARSEVASMVAALESLDQKITADEMSQGALPRSAALMQIVERRRNYINEVDQRVREPLLGQRW